MFCMQQKKLGAGILILLAVFVLYGCGARGPTNPPTSSTEFWNLTTGTEWTWNVTVTWSEDGINQESSTGTMAFWVISEEELENGNISKIKVETVNQPYPYDEGFFWGYIDNSYYEFGLWSTEPESPNYPELWYKEPVLLFTDPVFIGSKGFQDSTAIKQETVTVEAGTFDSWRFEYFHTEDQTTTEGTIWFTPNVGIIKHISIFTDNSISFVHITESQLATYSVP